MDGSATHADAALMAAYFHALKPWSRHNQQRSLLHRIHHGHSILGPSDESRDFWESPPRIRGSSVPQTPKNPETNSSSVDPNFDQYAFVFPCPGEGMGGIGEHCSLRNLCLECGLCTVCGHCSCSCPDYINMPSKPLMTPLVSIYFVG